MTNDKENNIEPAGAMTTTEVGVTIAALGVDVGVDVAALTDRATSASANRRSVKIRKIKII